MGVAIEVYRTRIGMFTRRIKNERNAVLCGPGSFSINMFFVGLVVMMLLVMGGVEVNPGPPADHLKLDLILEHVKNQGHETKTIREMLKEH
jgi:hypothetical protein